MLEVTNPLLRKTHIFHLLSRPHMNDEHQEQPVPRLIEGSLDPWTIEDDCLTMESNLIPNRLRSVPFVRKYLSYNLD